MKQALIIIPIGLIFIILLVLVDISHLRSMFLPGDQTGSPIAQNGDSNIYLPVVKNGVDQEGPNPVTPIPTSNQTNPDAIDPETGWFIYKDEVNGFQFLYPPAWVKRVQYYHDISTQGSVTLASIHSSDMDDSSNDSTLVGEFITHGAILEVDGGTSYLIEQQSRNQEVNNSGYAGILITDGILNKNASTLNLSTYQGGNFGQYESTYRVQAELSAGELVIIVTCYVAETSTEVRLEECQQIASSLQFSSSQ